MKAQTSYCIETSQLPWEPTGSPGIERRPLASDVGAGFETAILRLAPGARLVLPAGDGWEVVVLEGAWQLADGELAARGYSRRTAQHDLSNGTREGCTLFLRSGPLPAESIPVHRPFDGSSWLPGQGNLRVMPLHPVSPEAGGSEGTALVFWPQDERFLAHRHYGGEEILVLSGTFRDEHGTYPTGTWLLSPHGSEHHPFVEEETVIFVKTGHLPPA